MFRVAFVGVDNPHGSGWRDLLVNLQDQLQSTEEELEIGAVG